MKIIVYGKQGCGKCDAAKEKISLLGLEYGARELADFTAWHEGWREDGSAAVMAAHVELDTMPIIEIDGTFYDYAGAMRALKEIKKGKAVGK